MKLIEMPQLESPSLCEATSARLLRFSWMPVPPLLLDFYLSYAFRLEWNPINSRYTAHTHIREELTRAAIKLISSAFFHSSSRMSSERLSRALCFHLNDDNCHWLLTKARSVFWCGRSGRSLFTRKFFCFSEGNVTERFSVCCFLFVWRGRFWSFLLFFFKRKSSSSLKGICQGPEYAEAKGVGRKFNSLLMEIHLWIRKETSE